MICRGAICDDNALDAEFVEELLKKWARSRGVVVQSQRFSSAEQFWFRYGEDKAWDFLLLDIEMGDTNGVTLAKRIRQDNEAVQIIFITGFPDYLAQGYEVSALHYLMKPVSEDKLFAVLDRGIKALQKTEAAVLLPVDGELLRLPVSRIRYVEAFGHGVTVSTRDGVFCAKIPISEMEKTLGAGFVRCHRSYLVALKDIARISKTEVVLDDGQALPLSRTAAPMVHKAFIAFYTGEEYEAL